MLKGIVFDGLGYCWGSDFGKFIRLLNQIVFINFDCLGIEVASGILLTLSDYFFGEMQ